MTLVLLTLLTQAGNWEQYPGGSPKEQYAKAAGLIAAKQYGEATQLLNELAPANPKWAELYAARCSAQLGLGRPDTAAADCRYALAVKPTLYVALYGLATAEEKLGQGALAAQHYRQYAGITGAGVDPALQATAAQRAQVLESPQAPPPPPPNITINVTPAAVAAASPRRLGRARAVESSSCTSSLDCGPGGWCKDRGDGVNVCMNHGSHGDYCQSSIDCGAGGFCKDRGDGVNVCMSHGSAGEFCKSAIDCAGGLWCRERGDGLSVCMR
ncbi:MAG: hypothetical protein IPJ65_02005 [Archangiaceae bacterium]|nr:hypothetical protein [Archangiaceae bacterium]